jgi:peptide/nickel transport system substrate-binding protein
MGWQWLQTKRMHGVVCWSVGCDRDRLRGTALRWRTSAGATALRLLAGTLLATLAACSGTTAPDPPTATPAPVIQTVLVERAPEPIVATATPALEGDRSSVPHRDTIVIGTWQEPRSFLDYTNIQAIRGEIDMLFRPRFIWRRNYGLQPNIVLWEGGLPDLPTGRNASLRDVVVQVGEPVFSTESFTVTPATQAIQTQQLIITSTIKSGLRWSDGQPLTARDFVFGWRMLCSPDSGAVDQTNCPLGASPGAGGVINAIRASDDTTIVMEYAPGALDPTYQLGITAISLPLPEHLLGELSAAQIATDPRAIGGEAAVPIGWGPYVMREWQPGESITFEANPYWAGDAPKTPKITYRFFPDTITLAQAVITGEIDTTSGTTGLVVDQAPYMESIAKNGDIIYSVNSDSASFEMLYLNYNDPQDTTLKTPHPLLSDYRVRKAIALALDRQTAIETIYAGQAHIIQQPQLPRMTAYNEALGVIIYDVEQARALMESAGWTDSDGDGIRERAGARATMTILTTSGNEVRQKATQLWQANLRVIGIDVQLAYAPSSQVFSIEGLYGRAFDAVQFATIFSTADASGWWYGMAACSQIPSPDNGFAGSNFAGWCQRDASNAATRAAFLTLNTVERQAAWNSVIKAYFSAGDAADYRTGGYPVIPLFTRPSYLAHVPALRGPELDPTEYFTWNAAAWVLTQNT